MSTVLITGASGFVGRFLAHQVKNEGHQVFTYSGRFGQDVRNFEMLRDFLHWVQPDEVHHLAAQAYVPETTTNPARGFAVNTIGTLHLMEALRQLGSRARVHIAGTSEEYGYVGHGDVLTEDSIPQPTTLYGVSKLAAGQIAMQYHRELGIPVVVTRAWNHTGPSQPSVYAVPSFARQVAAVEAGRQDAVRHGNLHAVRSYSDVRDVIRLYRLAIGLPPGVYNLASTRETHSLGEILTRLTALAEGDIPAVEDRTLYRPGTQQGSPVFPAPGCDKLLTAIKDMHSVDWEPEFALDDTLMATLEFWRHEA